MEVADIISVIKDIVFGLSAIAVAFFAWLGLRTWRKELTGKAKFETSRNMMRLGLKLRANLEGVRHPLTGYPEYASRTKQPEESESESQVLNEWYAKANRINAVFENLTKIIEGKWEAEILFSESSVQSIEEAIKSYRESYADLSSAISTYFDIRRDEARTKELYKDQEWLKGLKKTIYSAQDDDFSKKVDEATDKLSSALKQYVK